MLRATLLYLSEKKGFRDWILKRRFARAAAYRFVAGDTLDDAIGACKALAERGMRASLDHLGESVTSRAAAESAVEAYLAAIERVATERLQASISLKLTQLGLEIDEAFCAENLARIVKRAHRHGIFVRIDMEGLEHVEATLRLHRHLFDNYKNVGVVIQSMLRRSEADVRELCAMRAPVRLVKGAYQEPEEVAFQKKSEVSDSFAKLLGMLVQCGSPLGVATHDPALIERAKSLVRARAPAAAASNPGAGEFGVPPFEFQLLYGVRRDLQERLRLDGYVVRVYIPYGTEWYAYLLRRLAERPANLMFLLRSVLRESFAR